MADLGDVLRHLVTYTQGSSPEGRAEMIDAINEEFGAPPEPPPAEVDPQAARIAELEAELEAAKAQAPSSG